MENFVHREEKEMKKTLSNILFIIYVVVAIFVTVCLLSYNDFKVTEFGDYSLVIISDEGLEPDFKKGDLVIVNKKSPIITGRKAFFYNTYDRKIEIKLGKIEAAEKVTATETTYTLEGERTISGQYVLGPSDTAEVIPTVGGILEVLESKWGFLFIIVLPSLLAFIYQISVVVSELRSSNDKGKKANNEQAK